VSFAGYALVVAAILGVSLGTLFLLPASRLDPAARNAAVLGALLGGQHPAASSYGLSEPEPPRRSSLSSEDVRMGLMLGAVVAAILALGLPSLPLATSLLGHFALFLVLELTLLHRRTPRRP
jgi:hypothetical protein